ncbi:hypothetical protein MHBO_002864 [Bonamia ostreae]|uniref:Uncharacterized protein n=1 Tax=Bonamia ostreae TaxID=126728 RepID=A0ABV2ANS0_9EUKA
MSELKNIDIQVLDASSSSDFVAVEDRSDLKIQSKMPLFAADFIENQNILLIGGGGGGRTGIRNGVIIGRIEGNGSQKTKDQNLKKMVFLKILNFDQNLARCIFVKSDLIAVSYGKYLVFIKNSEISNLLNEDRSPIEKIECERIGFNIKDPDFVVRHMSLNPDGNKMAVVISDNTISLHLLQIGSKWPKMEFEGTIIAPRQITSIAWSPNGQEIVIAYNWKYFSVFKSSSPHNEIARIPIESWLHRNDQIMAFKEAIFVNQKKLLFAVNLLKGKSPISGGAICFYERSFNDSQNWILKRFCVVNKSGVVLKVFCQNF